MNTRQTSETFLKANEDLANKVLRQVGIDKQYKFYVERKESFYPWKLYCGGKIIGKGVSVEGAVYNWIDSLSVINRCRPNERIQLQVKQWKEAVGQLKKEKFLNIPAKPLTKAEQTKRFNEILKIVFKKTPYEYNEMYRGLYRGAYLRNNKFAIYMGNSKMAEENSIEEAIGKMIETYFIGMNFDTSKNKREVYRQHKEKWGTVYDKYRSRV